MIRTCWLSIRSAVFYLGYSLLTAWFGFTAILFMSWLPYSVRRHYLVRWNHAVVWWLRWCCGVRYQVSGQQNLPKAPYVVLSKHQSQWETFFLQTQCSPLSTILKKELLSIPGFGWGLRLMNPIAINRGSPRAALKQMMTQGAERLREGISVLVFPEGTRTSTQQSGKYARGGANLATGSSVPVVFVAHNAGHCWPPHQFIKYPGVIKVEFSQALNTTDRSSREITGMAKEWIESKIVEFENYRIH